MDEIKIFGDLIKNRRLNGGWTLRTVANHIGCSTNYISQIEQGTSMHARYFLGLISMMEVKEVDKFITGLNILPTMDIGKNGPRNRPVTPPKIRLRYQLTPGWVVLVAGIGSFVGATITAFWLQ